MELLSNVVVLSIEMMSCDRAIVSVPPFTGEELPPELDALDPPPPQAVRATAAVAAIPTNLIRVVRVIDCLIVLPARRRVGSRSGGCRRRREVTGHPW